MNDINILSVAYQRKDAGDNRDLTVIIAEIESDLVNMQPPAPGPADETGFKSEVIGEVRTNYKIMGDGSMVKVVS